MLRKMEELVPPLTLDSLLAADIKLLVSCIYLQYSIYTYASCIRDYKKKKKNGNICTEKKCLPSKNPKNKISCR